MPYSGAGSCRTLFAWAVIVVRAEGLEPPQLSHQNLNLACLPIPPRPRPGRRSGVLITMRRAMHPPLGATGATRFAEEREASEAKHLV